MTTATLTLAESVAAAAVVKPYVHTSTIAPNPLAGDLPSVRLDIYANPEFPKKFGGRVRAAGGSFSECRGHHRTRFVTFKLANLPDGVPLSVVIAIIDEICADATASSMGAPRGGKKFTFVFDLSHEFRAGDASSWITVQQGRNIQDAARGFVKSYEEAVSRKLAPSVADVEAAREIARNLKAATEANFDAMLKIPGVVAVPHYIGRYTLPLANGLSLSLTADAKGLAIEGLSPYAGRRFTAAEVVALAAAIGGVALS
jgi:hypothetical protein